MGLKNPEDIKDLNKVAEVAAVGNKNKILNKINDYVEAGTKKLGLFYQNNRLLILKIANTLIDNSKMKVRKKNIWIIF